MVKQFYFTHITPSKSQPGSNSNEEVLHIPQSFRTRTALSDAILCHIQDTDFSGGVTPLQRCYWYILKPQLTGLTLLRSDTKKSPGDLRKLAFT